MTAHWPIMKKEEKIKESVPPPEPGSGSESEFSFIIVRVAVAQILQSIGFVGAPSPALNTLTNVATRYLSAVAKLSAASANSDGRTQSNVSDVVCSLEDLAGFPGYISMRSHSVFRSTVIRDLKIFVKYSDEIPFAQPLPPRRRVNKRTLRFRDGRVNYQGGGLKHVPRWLPVVPTVPAAESGKKREREARWGEAKGEEDRDGECGERKMVRRERGEELEKSVERARVSFKMGDNAKIIGRLTSVGVGKRVWCER